MFSYKTECGPSSLTSIAFRFLRWRPDGVNYTTLNRVVHFETQVVTWSENFSAIVQLKSAVEPYSEPAEFCLHSDKLFF